jgi:hypothetical protein
MWRSHSYIVYKISRKDLKSCLSRATKALEQLVSGSIADFITIRSICGSFQNVNKQKMSQYGEREINGIVIRLRQYVVMV